MADVFNKAVVAAAARSSQLGDELGRSLLAQLIALDATASAVIRDDYHASYESDPLTFFTEMNSGLDSLYQQLHATATTAAVFVGAGADPPLAVRTLAGLEDAANAALAHPLGPALRRRRRDVALLRWLLAVRNKAVQHRAENGYLGNRAIVMRMGFAVCRKPAAPDAARVRRARQLLRGLERSYGFELDPGQDSRSAIVYLDLASYALRETNPSDYDTARYVVEEAAAYDIVVSHDMLVSTDQSLAALIELAPTYPTSPAAECA